MRSFNATEIGFERSELVITTGIRKEFQVITKIYSIIATNPDNSRGKVIRKNAPILRQPSVIATSSNSAGILIMNPLIIQVLNGTVYAEKLRIKPTWVSSNLSFPIKIYHGISIRTMGKKDAANRKIAMLLRPRNLNRTKLYAPSVELIPTTPHVPKVVIMMFR